MSIDRKLLLAFLFISAWMCIGGYLAIARHQQALVTNAGIASAELAFTLIDNIDKSIHNRIEQLKIYAGSHELSTLAQRSNAIFRTIRNRDEYIGNIDQAWQEGRKTSFITNILANQLSVDLVSFMNSFEKEYGYRPFSELYVTNNYGVVIGASGRTSDYQQADETWYQQAITKQDFWIGDVEYDESSAVFASDIIINLYDGNTNQVGVFKAVLSIAEPIRIIQESELRDSYASRMTRLITRRGEMIFATGELIPMKPAPSEFDSLFDQSQHASEFVIASANFMGKKQKIFARSFSQGYRSYKGLGWSLIIEYDKNKVLAPIILLWQQMLGLMSFMLIVGGLFSVFIARSISRPLVKLCNASTRIARGHWDALADIKTNDEFGKLATAFNLMVTKLHESTVSRTYFDNIINSMPDSLVVVTPDGDIEMVNQATTDLLGYQQQELVGQPIDLIFAKEGHERLLFKECDIAALSRSGELKELEKCYLAKDGTKIPVFLSDSVMLDSSGQVQAVVLSVHDLREIKKATQQVKLRDNVINSTFEGILVTLPDGYIIDVNPAFSEITGYIREDVIGHSPWELLNACIELAPKFNSINDQVNSIGHWKGELKARHKNGSLLPLWAHISAVKNEEEKITHHVFAYTDISRMKQSEEQLNFLAHHDLLTRLPNRLLFTAHIRHALERARGDKPQVAIMSLNLDRFKNVNDIKGHEAGDLLLQTVARRLRDCLRDGDILARLDGDEFTIIVERLGGAHDAEVVAKKLLQAFERPFSLNQEELYVTASAGISLYPDDGSDPETLIKGADSALYRAKNSGKNNYQFYTADPDSVAVERFAMEGELRCALERDELEVYYQPQLSLQQNNIVGAEALVRWQHPKKGLLLPGVFLPVAEECGLIGAIGNLVLRKACAQAKYWQDIGLPPITLAVNIAGQQILFENISEQTKAALAESGLPPGNLELEITEGFFIGTGDGVINSLNELRDLGIRLSIDDFGTGYSSLSYLKRLPIDKLKIDQSFVRDLHCDKNDESIVRAVIALGHSMDIKIIAEGVEYEIQKELLKKEGCDEYQGFLCSKAVPADQFARLLEAETIISSKAVTAAN